MQIVIASSTGAGIFKITDGALYILVVILSTQDITKLLQVKSGFKSTIDWNKYQSKVTAQARNQYLDYLIDLSFHGVNSLFVLSFEDSAVRTGHTKYFFQK